MLGHSDRQQPLQGNLFNPLQGLPPGLVPEPQKHPVTSQTQHLTLLQAPPHHC